MMGDRLVMQESLFYEFCLDEFVPSNHTLRAIGQFVDLSDLPWHLGPFYSSIGRPSIDPELMIRMLLVGYCLGIRSERRLCEEVHLNLAYRWFCRLGLEGKSRTIPRFQRTATAASKKATPSGMFLKLSSAVASRKVWLAARASRWTPP